MKKLERSLSLWPVIAIGIGGMLGSGIFVLPGLAAAKTGPSVWLAYLLAGICVLPAALSKSELATAMPTSGGTYVYLERAFGPLIGTIAGIGLWLSLLLKSSFALVGFGAYLAVLAAVPVRPVAITFLFLILFLNILGVKKVGNVQLLVVSISLIGLGILLIFGIPAIDPLNLRPMFTEGTLGLGSATAFVFVSYAGVTKVAAIAEEIKNPDKNLPIAMLVALCTVTFIYASVTFTLAGNIPLDQLVSNIKPIYTLAESLGGRVAGILAAILGVITLISMANSGVLAASRFPFAMSRDNILPPFLKKLHPKYLTPVTTIVITCAVMALVIIFLDVEKIAKLASAFKVIIFIAVNACVIVLRETAVQWYQPAYKSPFYPWIQIFGILSGIALLILLGGFAIVAALMIALLGSLVYASYGRYNAKRSGVFKIYARRTASYLLFRKQRNELETVDDTIQEELEHQKDSSLDGALSDHADTVIPLFGKERSAEMLVEMGAALAHGRKVQVVHLNEVPDITILDALLEDSPVISSLNRRITAMSKERQVDVDFESAVTHDLVETIQEISMQTHCTWIVAGWDGKSSQGLFIRNPIGWLVTHLDSNFGLFKDNGVRYIRKILVALTPGITNTTFITACDRIAIYYQAEIELIRVVSENKSDENIEKLKLESKELLGNTESKFKLIIVKSKSPVKLIAETSTAFDLLIIGTTLNKSRLDTMLGSTKDKLADKVVCSVLRLSIK
ncbi:MAG: APA family basic amino acid/polyamine antiporter [Saprospiraceae bacterium]|jgi:APA family basic amino acid/polyamine antiporter